VSRSGWRPWPTGCPRPSLGCLKPSVVLRAGDACSARRGAARSRRRDVAGGRPHGGRPPARLDRPAGIARRSGTRRRRAPADASLAADPANRGASLVAASGGMVDDAARYPRRPAPARALRRRPSAQPGPGRRAACPDRRDALRRHLGGARPAAAAPRCLPASLVAAAGRVDACQRLGRGRGAGGCAGGHPLTQRARHRRALCRRGRCRRRAALRGGRGLVRWPGPAGDLRAAACG
jgi:hypothetical protein